MTHSFSGKKRKTNAWKTRTKTAKDYNWNVSVKTVALLTCVRVYTIRRRHLVIPLRHQIP